MSDIYSKNAKIYIINYLKNEIEKLKLKKNSEKHIKELKRQIRKNEIELAFIDKDLNT